jgi:hypothetical protein
MSLRFKQTAAQPTRRSAASFMARPSVALGWAIITGRNRHSCSKGERR